MCVNNSFGPFGSLTFFHQTNRSRVNSSGLYHFFRLNAEIKYVSCSYVLTERTDLTNFRVETDDGKFIFISTVE